MRPKNQAQEQNQSTAKKRPQKPVLQDQTPPTLETHPSVILQRAELDPDSLTPNDVQQLQRTIGNRGTGQILARTKRPKPTMSPSSSQSSLQHMLASQSIQLKSTVNMPQNATAMLKPSHATLIQRAVIEDKGQFYSDQAPNYRFNTREEAESLDNIITEYGRLRQAVLGRMSDMSKNDLARLQRIKLNQFNSWVPSHCRVKEVRQLHNQLHQLMRGRAFGVNEATITFIDNETWKEYADLLITDGFPEAQDLYREIIKPPSAQTFGYKYQLFKHMQERARYQLAAIEPTYGRPKPSTGYRPRADSRTVEGFTQNTQEDFDPYQQDRRKTVLTDYKTGYKDETHAEDFLGQVDKYGGVAQEGSQPYGGIEHTQSTPPELRYRFYRDRNPGWLEQKLPGRVAKIRGKNPGALPGGVYLGDNKILSPIESSSQGSPSKTNSNVSSQPTFGSSSLDQDSDSDDLMDFQQNEGWNPQQIEAARDSLNILYSMYGQLGYPGQPNIYGVDAAIDAGWSYQEWINELIPLLNQANTRLGEHLQDFGEDDVSSSDESIFLDNDSDDLMDFQQNEGWNDQQIEAARDSLSILYRMYGQLGYPGQPKIYGVDAAIRARWSYQEWINKLIPLLNQANTRLGEHLQDFGEDDVSSSDESMSQDYQKRHFQSVQEEVPGTVNYPVQGLSAAENRQQWIRYLNQISILSHTGNGLAQTIITEITEHPERQNAILDRLYLGPGGAILGYSRGG